jgi:branched-chain amino acid transport system permease protein
VMKAMIIIIMGGMGSVPGAIVGGYILGLVESLGGGFIPGGAAYKDAFAFGALIVVLAVKPTGLFGREVE